MDRPAFNFQGHDSHETTTATPQLAPAFSVKRDAQVGGGSSPHLQNLMLVTQLRTQDHGTIVKNINKQASNTSKCHQQQGSKPSPS